MSAMLRRLLFAPLIAAISVLPIAAQGPLATDLAGHPVTQLAPPGSHVLVLIFAATDCPISNRYVPEIARLEQAFAAQHVAFRYVFPNPGDTASAIRRHNADFTIATPSLIDTQQSLVHLAHVSVTPEAAVFTVSNSQLKETYHGRIDDRYLAFDRERPQATKHDLESAITAALAGRPAPAPARGPVGCSIVPAAPLASATPQP